MSSKRSVGGVISAVLFYRNPDHTPDWESFERNLHLLESNGVDGVCVNGATGEYASATAEERREVVARARRAMGDSRLVLSGAGAAHWRETVERAQDAEEEGVDAHLIPAPHFFPYQQDDLAEFYRRVSVELQKPIIIYNLPQFTGRIELQLAVDLIRDPGNRIQGIKDSSGKLDILEDLTSGGPADAVRLVGNDAVLAEAMRNGWCGGMISGVAGVLPELNQALWDAHRAGDQTQFDTAARLLMEFIDRLGPWPTPWGLKLAAEARGIGPTSLALPLSARRKQQAEEFRGWFEPWWIAAASCLSIAKSHV